jgi:hypothetical protein
MLTSALLSLRSRQMDTNLGKAKELNKSVTVVAGWEVEQTIQSRGHLHDQLCRAFGVMEV